MRDIALVGSTTERAAMRIDDSGQWSRALGMTVALDVRSRDQGCQRAQGRALKAWRGPATRPLTLQNEPR